jgi:predicted alpha/beta hydrolase
VPPELVSIVAADGASSTAQFHGATQPRAAALVLPAMGVNARSYGPFAEALAVLGVSVLVAEHRGGETSSVRPARGVDYGYAELLGELPLLLGALRARAPGLPIDLVGHSMGGQLAVAGLSRWHAPSARLVLLASGTVHHRAWAGLPRLGVWVGTTLAEGVARGLGYFPGHRLGFGGRQGRELIIDWARASRTGMFTSGGVSVEHALDTPLAVLAISVSGDTYAPPNATRQLVAKLSRAEVSHAAVLPPSEPRRLNPHFRWLRAPGSAAQVVATFLGERRQGSN